MQFSVLPYLSEGTLSNPFSLSLQGLRRHRGVRQKALARSLGVDASYLCALENGRKAPPRNLEFFARLQIALELSPREVSLLREAGQVSHELGDMVAGASLRQSMTAIEFFKSFKKMRVEHLQAIDAIVCLATGAESSSPAREDTRSEFTT